MKHQAYAAFWDHYAALPQGIRALADRNFDLLKANPRHPSLQLKKVGHDLYSVRVGLDYRALAFDMGESMVWFWIGRHDDYDRLIRKT